MSAAWEETVLRDKYSLFFGCCCLFFMYFRSTFKNQEEKKPQNVTQHALWKELF